MKNLQHISKSCLWNRVRHHVFWIFWAIYLDPEDKQYKAVTISYKFYAEDDTLKAKQKAYTQGWEYIQETLGRNKAYEFLPQFRIDGEVSREYDVFAVAPYEVPLAPNQTEEYDPFFPDPLA